MFTFGRISSHIYTVLVLVSRNKHISGKMIRQLCLVVEYKRITNSNRTCLPRHALVHTNRNFEKIFQFSTNNITYFRRLNLYMCGTIDEHTNTCKEKRKIFKYITACGDS